ncbi:MAG: hypothetical protein AABX93_03095 [Nanoarchaeota archaeon]
MISEIKNSLEDFLTTKIIESNFMFLDYWTFIHFGSGVMVMFLIFLYFKKMKMQKKFLLLFLIIALWEIFELISSTFRPETKLDIFYDLIIGMIGGAAVHYFKK